MADTTSGTAGWIGVHLGSTEYSVEPGGSLVLSPIVANNGPEDDAYTLAVQGIPGGWFSTASPLVVVPAGEQREANLTIHPPRHFATKAGRRTITIQAQSQSAVHGRTAETTCFLTVGIFAEFGVRLHPDWQASGQPFRLTVQNRGNIQDIFTLTCRSLDGALRFEPAAAQDLLLTPGQESALEFRAWSRRRPLLGGERVEPLLLQVESLTGKNKRLRAEITSRALLPKWLLLGLFLFIFAFGCMLFALILTQGL